MKKIVLSSLVVLVTGCAAVTQTAPALVAPVVPDQAAIAAENALLRDLLIRQKVAEYQGKAVTPTVIALAQPGYPENLARTAAVADGCGQAPGTLEVANQTRLIVTLSLDGQEMKVLTDGGVVNYLAAGRSACVQLAKTGVKRVVIAKAHLARQGQAVEVAQVKSELLVAADQANRLVIDYALLTAGH